MERNTQIKDIDLKSKIEEGNKGVYMVSRR